MLDLFDESTVYNTTLRSRAGIVTLNVAEVQEHRIVVIACFHDRRNPKRWQSR
jgi:hypothetical protein